MDVHVPRSMRRAIAQFHAVFFCRERLAFVVRGDCHREEMFASDVMQKVLLIILAQFRAFKGKFRPQLPSFTRRDFVTDQYLSREESNKNILVNKTFPFMFPFLCCSQSSVFLARHI